MKHSVTLSLVLALSTVIPAVSHAQSGGMKDMDMKAMDHKSMSKDNKPSKTHKAVGVVKKVDAKDGMVTLAHGPVESLKWPAMTMGFKVKDKRMLDQLALDKKVEIEFEEHGKEHVITRVK